MRQVSYGDYDIPTELRTHLLGVAHKITNELMELKSDMSEQRRDSLLFHYHRTWKNHPDTEPMHPMDMDYEALEHNVEALSGLQDIYRHDNSRSWLSLEIANMNALMVQAVDTNDNEWFTALSERHDTLLRALYALDTGWALYNKALFSTSDDDTEDDSTDE